MTIPIQCDLNAVTDDERTRLFALTDELFGRVISLTSDDSGHELEFQGNDPELVAKLADFAQMDARCCAFVDHGLTIPAGRGNVRLTLRGEPGAGQALEHDIHRRVPATVLAQAR